MGVCQSLQRHRRQYVCTTGGGHGGSSSGPYHGPPPKAPSQWATFKTGPLDRPFA